MLRPLSLVSFVLTLALALAAPPGRAADLPQYRGVQLHSLWWESTDAEMDRELDLAQHANANVVRVDVVWGSLESEAKGELTHWYLKKLDRFVMGASRRDMQVVAMLWSSPCWGSSAPESLKQGCKGAWWDRGVGAYPPQRSQDYADIARFVTQRYGNKLAALEVWNEPNLSEGTFWNTSQPAADYAQLLRAAYPAAKAGNPTVSVLAGALAFSDSAFLERLYAEGIAGHYDGISLHPYNEWRHPSDVWHDKWKMYTLMPGLRSVRDVQLQAGDRKPIWITEFGWTTATGDRWSVTPAEQAEYVEAAFPLVGGLDYVEAGILYNLRDKGDDPGSKEDNFGLVDREFNPKPAYEALVRALSSTSVPAGGPVPSPGQSGVPYRSRPRRAGRLTLRVAQRGSMTYVVGTAPKHRKVRVQLKECRRRATARVVVVADSRNRFSRRLGKTRSLVGCRVSARLVGRPDRVVLPKLD